MAYSITKKQLAGQPVLQVTRRVTRPEIAKAIGEALALVMAYAQRNGIAVVGAPFARYPEMGPAQLTL
ncbi:MAG: hypothetical protein JOZ22_17180, partial [Acidobacteriia bacterium]|nr:hypothetical protein [Terriglobia bacterium]